jgi:phosphatidate cytidylyltransferase
MFKARLLSILLLVPILLLALFKIPTAELNILAAIVIVLAIVEWAQMLKLSRLLTVLVCGLFMLLPFMQMFLIKINYPLVFEASTIFWLLSFLLLLQFPQRIMVWKMPYIQTLYFIPIFAPAFIAFSYINIVFGPKWLLFGLCLVFSADIGAYIFGKLFGNKKLAPQISPGKTVMGFYGAILSGILVSLAFSLLTGGVDYYWMIFLGVTTVLFSVNGDLVQSALKRVHGIKDSGTLIPGHGGVFDRLDSIVGAFPTFALISYYLLQANLIYLDRL